jgi:hypothetical protein
MKSKTYDELGKERIQNFCGETFRKMATWKRRWEVDVIASDSCPTAGFGRPISGVEFSAPLTIIGVCLLIMIF